MTILDKIVETKKSEVASAKSKVSLDELQGMPFFERKCYSFVSSLLNPLKTGIIAEYKRASPSKGLINGKSTVQDVVKGYQAAGASAVSVLTDSQYFQGNLFDLLAARQVLDIPVLRKEFVIDPYQITEAKAYGADLILLIAACLEPAQVEEYAAYAKGLGLSVLLEVHDQFELEKNLFENIDAIGVNNRNLKDFTVSVERSFELVDQIPARYAKISESGISDSETIKKLKAGGFQGFLIGENFMKTNDPASAISDFVKEL